MIKIILTEEERRATDEAIVAARVLRPTDPNADILISVLLKLRGDK